MGQALRSDAVSAPANRRYGKLLIALATAGCGLGFAPMASAYTLIGSFDGTDCGGQGGFPNCYAYNSPADIHQGQTGGGSPSIFKYNFGGGTEVNAVVFPSVTGSEFAINFNATLNTLGFTYTPGTGDPVIHYFAIKQGDMTKLFYDAAPITSASGIQLGDLFPDNPGFSHITFFDSAGGGGSTPPVPEPATWAMMILGLGFVGAMMRRKQSATVRYRFA